MWLLLTIFALTTYADQAGSDEEVGVGDFLLWEEYGNYPPPDFMNPKYYAWIKNWELLQAGMKLFVKEDDRRTSYHDLEPAWGALSCAALAAENPKCTNIIAVQDGEFDAQKTGKSKRFPCQCMHAGETVAPTVKRPAGGNGLYARFKIAADWNIYRFESSVKLDLTHKGWKCHHAYRSPLHIFHNDKVQTFETPRRHAMACGYQALQNPKVCGTNPMIQVKMTEEPGNHDLVQDSCGCITVKKEDEKAECKETDATKRKTKEGKPIWNMYRVSSLGEEKKDQHHRKDIVTGAMIVKKKTCKVDGFEIKDEDYQDTKVLNSKAMYSKCDLDDADACARWVTQAVFPVECRYFYFAPKKGDQNSLCIPYLGSTALAWNARDSYSCWSKMDAPGNFYAVELPQETYTTVTDSKWTRTTEVELGEESEVASGSPFSSSSSMKTAIIVFVLAVILGLGIIQFRLPVKTAEYKELAAVAAEI